jgi:hypothetical protein
MGSGAAEGPGEPVVGANVVRLLQTVPDSRRPFLQVGGSPSDSARLRQTDWLRMACKRSGVRTPIASPQFRGFFRTISVRGSGTW